MIKVWIRYCYYGNAHRQAISLFGSLHDFAVWLFGDETLHDISIYGRRNGKKTYFDDTSKNDEMDVCDKRDNDWWINTGHYSYGRIGTLSRTRIERVDVDGKCFLNSLRGETVITASGYEKIIKPLIAELKESRGLDDAVVYAD